MPDNLWQVPVDLAEKPLSEVLENLELWDTSACSFVSAEGLTQYLTEDIVRVLFETVDAKSGPSSHFAFTFVGWREDEGRPEAGPHTERLLADFEKRGEPWLWGLPTQGLRGFLNGTPWELVEEPRLAGIETFACAEKKPSA
jgi:O-methyltransferase involved in polyketide biosynthesis